MTKGKEGKPHIGIFGRRNNGKSSLINLLANQEVAIVSDFAGTTTDPVKKSIEIAGLGPVILVDTAGIDDEGTLGKKRIQKTEQALKQVDLGILVLSHNGFGYHEQQLIDALKEYGVPCVVVHNKEDEEKLTPDMAVEITKVCGSEVIALSARYPDKAATERVVTALREQMPESAYRSRSLVGDVIKQGDIVLLITPIDIEAPEGRLILPQVQAIRDILDNDCTAIVVKEREVDNLLRRLSLKPALAITDSQVFLKADASIPSDIPLTSFSIVLARQKGDFDHYIKGTPYISKLKNGDKVLILESCTHHVSCDDIGRVKIPRWISDFTGKQLEYTMVSGLNDLPESIENYAIVIQCGGCVVTPKQLAGRLKPAIDAGVPVTNYGMAIAYVQGIFHRAVAPFIELKEDSSEYL